MRLLRGAHNFEYRDSAGIDQFAQADIWETVSGDQAVLVLRGLNVRGSAKSGEEGQVLLDQARQAHGYLAHSWLPFVAPHARLSVLVLRPRQSVSADEADAGQAELSQADLSWAGSIATLGAELAQGKTHALVL